MTGDAAPRVPVPLAIRAGESLFGFMERVAERNYYVKSTWLLDNEWHRRMFNSANWNEAAFVRLASFTDVAIDDIKRRAYAYIDTFGNSRDFFGHTLPSSLIAQTNQWARKRYCPECLAEGIHHAIFDLHFVAICPRHRLQVITHCPHCKKPLLFGGGELTRCSRCDGDLFKVRTKTAADGAVAALGAIIQKIGLPPPFDLSSGRMTDMPAALAHLTAADTLKLIFALPRCLGHPLSATAGLDFNHLKPAEFERYVGIGWHYLERWPEGFSEFVNDVRKLRGTDKSLCGAQATFGPVERIAATATAEPWLTFRNQLRIFVRDQWKGFVPDQAAAWLPSEFRSDLVPISVAAVTIGRATSNVRCLIKNGILTEVAGPHTENKTQFVHKADLDRIAPGGKPPIDAKTLYERLGLHWRRFTPLLKAGVFEPVLGPEIDGSSSLLFRATDVSLLLKDIEKHLITADAVHRAISFKGVCLGAMHRGIDLKAVVDSMRNGQLPVISIDRQKIGVDAYSFDRRKAREMLTCFSEQKEAGSELSFLVACRRLGVSHPTLSEIVEGGWISVSRRDNRERWISRESFETFCDQYFLMDRAAVEVGFKNRQALMYALSKTSVPIKRAGRAVFIEQAVLRANLEHLRSA